MRPRRIGVLAGTAVTVLLLDIISKVTVVATLSDHPPVRLLGGFLTMLVSRNPGAAFSIGTSMTLVFSAIAIGVVVTILRTSRRIRSIPWALTLGLLLGGATGNLIDRIFRYPGIFRGYVVDWIEVPHWPVFNLADSAIVCGGVLAVLLSARGTRLDGLRVLSSNATAQASSLPEAGHPQSAAPQPGTPQPGIPQPAAGQRGSDPGLDAKASDDPSSDQASGQDARGLPAGGG